MELVEKKKLTEQFKTVEGLIDRAVRKPRPMLMFCFLDRCHCSLYTISCLS